MATYMWMLALFISFCSSQLIEGEEPEILINDEMTTVAAGVPDHECSKVMCRMYCRAGFQKDEYGCDICKCQDYEGTTEVPVPELPVLQHECSRIMCRMFCDHGFQRDEYGCEICKCATEDPCALIDCADFAICIRGECIMEGVPEKEEHPEEPMFPCAVPMCANFCEFGYAVNEHGCETCDCKLRDDTLPYEPRVFPCAEPMCTNLCDFGYDVDERGCDTCICKLGNGRPAPPGIGESTTAQQPMCPEPSCAVFCPNGRLTDVRGCETCDCVEYVRDNTSPAPAPDKWESTTAQPCAIPMCITRCPFGYANNERGCMTCECNESPDGPEDGPFPWEFPEVDLVPECRMLKCVERPCPWGYAMDEAGCQTCECATDEPIEPMCPEPSCAVFCPNGRLTDVRGCETCDCVEDVCNGVTCDFGMICKPKPMCGNPFEACLSAPQCGPPPLCELQQEMGLDDLLRMRDFLSTEDEDPTDQMTVKPRCMPDGSFAPKQCLEGINCWCVDDRGFKVTGSDWDLDDEEELLCEHNVTQIVQLVLQLKHDLENDDIEDALDDIRSLLQETIGNWMGIRPGDITVVKVETSDTGVISVEIVVIHNKMNDLPSAVHHLYNNIKEGRCHLNYGAHTLTPTKDSVSVAHHYSSQRDSHHKYIWTRKRFVIPCVGAAVILIIIMAVSIVIYSRKRMASYQFAHKKLEKMENFKNNLILSTDWEKPDLVCTVEDECFEKKPLA